MPVNTQLLKSDSENVKEDYIVSSLVRGLTILSSFSMKKPSLKVSEIAEYTGMDQATVFRFIYTLEHLGYLIRDEDTKRYRMSVRMLSLVLPAREGIAVRDVALPYMSELSKRINESVKLAILDGIESVIVAVVEILDKLTYRTPIGHRNPVYCSSMGKALFAYQPVETWDKLIPKIEFTPRTDRTITDPNKFREELIKIRNQGYAIQDSELVVGLGSIAVPIFDHSGDVTGAINISGVSVEILQNSRIEFYISELKSTAQLVSNKLGYFPVSE
jgi:DNA-binding IclR family transcriptional regulator